MDTPTVLNNGLRNQTQKSYVILSLAVGTVRNIKLQRNLPAAEAMQGHVKAN